MHTDLVTHSAHEPFNHDQPHLYNLGGERMMKHTGVVKEIDETDPNDMAFKLVTMFVYLLCHEYSFFLLFCLFL
jgi:hypothetical protein